MINVINIVSLLCDKAEEFINLSREEYSIGYYDRSRLNAYAAKIILDIANEIQDKYKDDFTN